MDFKNWLYLCPSIFLAYFRRSMWFEKELNFTDKVSSYNRETLSHSSRFLSFLKLFLGMGILWIFGIVAGFLGHKDVEEEGKKDEW